MPIRDTNVYPAFAAGQEAGIRNELVRREVQQENELRHLLAQYAMPGSTPEAKDAAFDMLMAHDPATARQVVEVEQGRRQTQLEEHIRTATEGRGMANYVLTSEDPVMALRILDDNELVREDARRSGFDPDDPEDVREIARILHARYDMAVGLAEGERNSLQQKLETVSTTIGRPLTEQEVMQLAGSGGTTINIGEKLNEPIPIAQLDTVRMPDGTTVPIGTTFAEAREMGAQVVSTNETSRRQQAEQALGILDELESMALGPGGVFEEIEPGLMNRAGAAIEHGFQMLTQNDPGASRFNDMAKATLAPFIKFMGESGALADGDVTRALGLLPRTFPLPDTREVAEGKFDVLRQIVSRGVANMNAINAGQLPNLEPILQEDVELEDERPTAASTARAAGRRMRDVAGDAADLAADVGADLAGIARMSLQQLQSLDIDEMTEDQLNALQQRLDELGL